MKALNGWNRITTANSSLRAIGKAVGGGLSMTTTGTGIETEIVIATVMIMITNMTEIASVTTMIITNFA
jgi:hypothetical protein